MVNQDHTVEMNYNLITDGIFIGTNGCCATHFDESLITTENIEADISLEAERMDSPRNLKYFLWLPTPDKHAPQQEQLKVGVAALAELVNTNKKTYVHCMNGHGRAPTLVAAYLIKTKSMGADEAVALIKEKRPAIHLEEEQKHALHTFSKAV